MLARCPLKNSQEWKDLMEKHNGNEARAREEWDELYENDDSYYTLVEEGDVIEQPEAEPHSFDKALDKVKVYLREKTIEVGKRKSVNQRKKEEDQKRLEKMINELEGVEAINAFIDDAFQKSLDMQSYFNSTIKNYQEGELTGKKFLERIVDINDFANSYSILDEIADSDVKQFFTGTVSKPIAQYTPQDKLKVALSIREAIKAAFVQEAIPIMAETLVNYRNHKSQVTIQSQIEKFEREIQEIREGDAPTNSKLKAVEFREKELEKWKNMLLDKNRMEEILKTAVRDEGIFDYLVNPLISSEDSALALFAKMIKSSFEEARMDDIVARDEAVDKLKEFRDRTSRSVNNVADFNEGLYEEVSILRRDARGKAEKVNGELVFDKRMSFVQKFDLNKYAEAQSQWYKDNPKPQLKENPTAADTSDYNTALKKWYIERSDWYARNTRPKSKEEILKIKADKRAEVDARIITEEEYDEWLTTVERVDKRSGAKIFMKELAEPSEKYLNEKWKKLYDLEGNPISPEGEYHKYLTDMYLADQEVLPKTQQLGLILPSIPMENWERLQRQGVVKTVKTNVQDAFTITARDQAEYGVETLENVEEAKKDKKKKLSKEEEDALFEEQKERLDPSRYKSASLSGESLSFLPVYYTQPMSVDDVSVDLIGSVLKFSSMTRRYNAMNKLNAEINAFRTIIGKRAVPEVNSKGEPIYNIVAKRLGYEEYIRQNGESYSKKHVDAFIDMVIRGESQQAETLFNLEVSKIANTFMGFSAITTIAVDVLKGTANNLQGNIQVLIEAIGGEYFNAKNLAVGKTKYWAKVGGAISDFAQLKPESWLGQLTERYDPIQGTFKDEYGKDVSASVANKLFRTKTLFFNQNFAEHEIQVSTMLALFDATKVIDKATGEEITLLAAHEKYGPDLFEITKDENGKKVKDYKVQVKTTTAEGVEETVDFDERQRQEVMNTLHALNKRMHGVYNDFDKGTSQKYALGRLLLMYRKHLYPSYKRRYKDVSFDEELGAPTEGIYRVFWRTMLKDIRVYKLNVSKRWQTMTPFEKAQVKKVLAELGIILALAGLILAMTAMAGGDDDEEKKQMSYVYNFVLYEAIRMRSETTAYLPVVGFPDLYRNFKSPSAVMNTTDRFAKFINQFLLTWDDEKLVYQKDTGIWEKGDNKSWAYFLRLMGYSGYNLTPEAAIKSFKSTFVK
jgi:hypothetical protein